VEIRNKYNDLLTAKDNVELASKWENIQKRSLKMWSLSLKRPRKQGRGSKSKGKISGRTVSDVSAIRDFNVLKAEFEALYN